MWKIKEIALFLEKSAEKFCRFKKNLSVHYIARIHVLEIVVFQYLKVQHTSVQSTYVRSTRDIVTVGTRCKCHQGNECVKYSIHKLSISLSVNKSTILI